MGESQLGQDVAVLDFYNYKQNGYFVEIGASDGITLSNTFLLEKSYGWKGICVEPIPEMYEKCKQNRSCICSNLAVYNTSGQKVSFDIAENSLLSGIQSHIDCYKDTVEKNKTTIQVNTISLLDLLIQNNAPSRIDYLSLDTEGTEYEILKPFDFNQYTFGLIVVEHNFIEPRRTDIRNLLLSNGYSYIGENRWDDMYASP